MAKLKACSPPRREERGEGGFTEHARGSRLSGKSRQRETGTGFTGGRIVFAVGNGV